MEYEGERLNSLTGFKYDVKISFEFLRHFFWVIKMGMQRIAFLCVKHLNGGRFKNGTYRLFGAKIGKDVHIAPEVYIDDFLPELITIEDGVIIGLRSTILTHEFTIKHGRFGRVRIGRQAIIGANSTVRSGVTVGDRALVAMCPCEQGCPSAG
jgi:acetyltransferase-like isoleucine patch superfamily enzyme